MDHVFLSTYCSTQIKQKNLCSQALTIRSPTIFSTCLYVQLSLDPNCYIFNFKSQLFIVVGRQSISVHYPFILQTCYNFFLVPGDFLWILWDFLKTVIISENKDSVISSFPIGIPYISFKKVFLQLGLLVQFYIAMMRQALPCSLYQRGSMRLFTTK